MPSMNTITVNGFTVPAPLSEIPPHTTHVWRAEPNHPEFATQWTTQGIEPDLFAGLVHLTRAAAQAHGKALKGIDPNGDQP